MSNCIAERRLRFTLKGSNVRNDLVIQIYQPYLVTQDMESFRVDENTAGCKVVITGLPEEFSEVVYGADLLQALQLAADVEPMLKRLSNRYEFYFSTGEPYFE